MKNKKFVGMKRKRESDEESEELSEESGDNINEIKNEAKVEKSKTEVIVGKDEIVIPVTFI